ncbi:DMT family transporter [Nonomuraea sp. NPDC003754]
MTTTAVASPTPPYRRARANLHGHRLALLGAALCWGLAAVAIEHALAAIPWQAMLGIQLGSATATLWVLSLAAGHRRPHLTRGLILLALTEPGLSSALFVAGMLTATAATGSILANLEGLIVALAGVLVLGERLRPLGWLGLALSLPGVWLLDGATTSWGDRTGTLLIVAGTLCAALGSVLAARLLRRRSDQAQPDPLSATVWQFTIATAALAVVIIPLSLATPFPMAPGLTHWAAAVASGVIGLALPYALFNRAIATVPVTEASLLLQLTPVMGIGAAVVLLGERLTPGQMAGAALTVLAVALHILSTIQRMPRYRPAHGRRGAHRASYARSTT